MLLRVAQSSTHAKRTGVLRRELRIPLSCNRQPAHAIVSLPINETAETAGIQTEAL
jgi:hypothetical protein